MAHNPIRLTIVSAAVLTLAACDESQDVATPPSVSPNAANATQKSTAGNEGLAEALRDIEALRPTLRRRSPEELIASFVPDRPDRRFGGYDYFYNFMANIEIERELALRGDRSGIGVETPHRG